MSEKSIYKKATGSGWNYKPETARAKEDKFFEKIASDKVAKGKKTTSKTVERSDHKHEYHPAVVWVSHWRKKDKKQFFIANVCPACGRTERINFHDFFRQDEGNEQPYFGELPQFERQENEDKLVKIEQSKYAQKIFLGGSKTLIELSVEMKNALKEYMHAGATFLIGDTTGADLLMQKFLAKNGYQKVIVYTVNNRARVNVGVWGEKQVKSYDGQEAEREMVNEADEGVMLFKENTPNTMASVELLISQGKTCKVALKRETEGIVRYREVFSLEDERAVEWLKRELAELSAKS